MTVVPKGYFYYGFFWVGKTPFFPHCRNKMVENYSPIASSLLWNSFDETPNNPLIGLKQKPWLFKIPYQRLVPFHKWDLNFVRFINSDISFQFVPEGFYTPIIWFDWHFFISLDQQKSPIRKWKCMTLLLITCNLKCWLYFSLPCCVIKVMIFFSKVI